MNGTKKITALTAVLVVVLTSYSCAMYAFDDDDEEDGNLVVAAVNIYNISVNIEKVYKIYKVTSGTYSKASLLAGILLGMPVGATLEKLYMEQELEDLRNKITELQQTIRLNEANNTVTDLSLAKSCTYNSFENYTQLWGYTEEHWIRQAEMAAFDLWNAGAGYSTEEILVLSLIYFNDAMESANSVAQINTVMSELTSHVKTWSTTEGYGSMSAYYSADGSRILSSGSDFGGRLLSVADARDSEGYVYIQTELTDTSSYVKGESDTVDVTPGTLYLFGTDTVTLTDREGNAFTFSSRETDLSKVDGLSSGVYKVSKGAVIASDSLAEAVGVDGSLGLSSGFVMEADGSYALAKYTESSAGQSSLSIIRDGQADSLVSNLCIGAESSDIPSGKSNPEPVDITSLLSGYYALLKEIKSTATSADTSARALWKIYDAAGESNTWATTLSVLENYETVAMNDSMKAAMTASAMSQIAAYYGDHSGDLSGMKLNIYGTGTEGVPFVRGTIYDENGQTVASDVIFTPLIQTEDATLTKSETCTVSGYATAMVWAQGQGIQSWAASGDLTDYTCVPMKSGYTFSVNELAVLDDDDSAMRYVNSVDLTVRQLEYIEGEGFNWVDPEPIPPEKTSTNYLQIICMAAGLLLILYGILSRRLEIIILGAGVLVFAWVFADKVWDWLGRLV